MKIVTNAKLIKRNAAIGKYTSIAALVILGAGLFITFKYPDKFIYSMGCLLGGFLLSQFGIYFGNRWGRSPRPDQIINKSMKGMGREYTVYHFVTPASHLLVGPAGVWTILPFYQGGKITFDGKRWRSRGGGLARSYMRLFGQENMGRPDMDAATETKTLAVYLRRILPEGIGFPEVHSALLFTDPNVDLQSADSPIPAMTPKDLKDFLKGRAKENPLPPLQLDAIRKALPLPDKDEE